MAVCEKGQTERYQSLYRRIARRRASPRFVDARVALARRDGIVVILDREVREQTPRNNYFFQSPLQPDMDASEAILPNYKL